MIFAYSVRIEVPLKCEIQKVIDMRRPVHRELGYLVAIVAFGFWPKIIMYLGAINRRISILLRQIIIGARIGPFCSAVAAEAEKLSSDNKSLDHDHNHNKIIIKSKALKKPQAGFKGGPKLTWRREEKLSFRRTTPMISPSATNWPMPQRRRTRHN